MLFVSVFGAGLALTGGSVGDLMFVAMYGLAFTALLASSAIHNERRSRRILAVLSKGIERGQYLAGLLTGVMLAMTTYCVVIGVVATATLARSGAAVGLVWTLAIMLFALFALVAAAALFFSTFLHPLFAATAAAALLGGTGVLGNALGGAWRALLPAYSLVEAAMGFGAKGWQVPRSACSFAMLEALIFWGLATAVFSRRDIAVAVE